MPVQVFWTNGMRVEVMNFISGKLESAHLTGVMDADAGCTFRFTSLADELVLAGVYIKHFLSDPAMPLDDPYQLCHELLKVPYVCAVCVCAVCMLVCVCFDCVDGRLCSVGPDRV